MTNESEKMRMSEHFLFLEEAYKKVGLETWAYEDFQESSLKSSRSLFTEASLTTSLPIPKKLEVYALLSGLPFESNFSKELVKIQQEIDEILSKLIPNFNIKT